MQLGLHLIVGSAQANEVDMKETSSSKHARNGSLYSRKRPSPNGVSKSNRTPLLPPYGIARKTVRSTKSALMQQRQREAAALAIRRAGLVLENEYRDEIRCYMSVMEVVYFPDIMQTLWTDAFSA
jgi:G2/mitotic-specific cyclin-B, other